MAVVRDVEYATNLGQGVNLHTSAVLFAFPFSSGVVALFCAVTAEPLLPSQGGYCCPLRTPALPQHRTALLQDRAVTQAPQLPAHAQTASGMVDVGAGGGPRLRDREGHEPTP